MSSTPRLRRTLPVLIGLASLAFGLEPVCVLPVPATGDDMVDIDDVVHVVLDFGHRP